ncbi:MAG: aldehyde dehydrogenase family protein, partial [Flavobacteriaceae bacterium]|nr:aldehyde dehydrogenase family protein [Flavobacteriaceae bacterium]
AGGNTCVVLASEKLPLCAVSFSEIIATSDVPGGVVNIITGKASELINNFASHMNVNAILYCGSDKKVIKNVQDLAIENIKRVVIRENSDYFDAKHDNLYYIFDFQETKTTWHPIEQIGGSGSGY